MFKTSIVTSIVDSARSNLSIFNDLKIEYAKELLSAGHSVTQTAALAGFANQAYFSAAFKRITGRLPKEYFGDQRAPRAPRKPASL